MLSKQHQIGHSITLVVCPNSFHPTVKVRSDAPNWHSRMARLLRASSCVSLLAAAAITHLAQNQCHAQSIPSTFGRTPSTAEVQQKQPNNDLELEQNLGGAPRASEKSQEAKSCQGGQYCRVLLPLNRGNVDGAAIHSFFNTGNSGVSYLDQVQYLYGFGGGTNTLSADMIGASTGFGLHITLGNSVTAGSSSQNNSSPTTPSVAIQQLESGGDFYVKGLWPLVDAVGTAKTGGKQHFIVAFVPKLAFNFQGFGSQSTITEATEENWNGSVEANYDYPLYPDSSDTPVSFYADARTGYQGVQGAFARKVGLGHELNFPLTEVAAGINFAGFRFGFQRFAGPAAAFAQTDNPGFGRWHLTVQFSPNVRSAK